MRRRPLPHSLPARPLRHELPEAMANRLLCDVLEQFAVKQGHPLTSRPDPLVEYANGAYRLVGDLLEGTLYEIDALTPQFHITGGLLWPRAGGEGARRWDIDRSVPPVRALEQVSYVLERSTSPRQEARSA